MEENKVEENKIEDKTEKTFKELYLAGEIGFDEIDRYISHWNNSDDEPSGTRATVWRLTAPTRTPT